MMNKKIKWILSFFTISFIAISILFEIGAPYLIIKPLRIHRSIIPDSLGMSYETLDIKVDSALNIKGWLCKPKTNPKAIIVVVHGIGGNKEGLLNTASFLIQNNIAAVIYDQRAHGESGGTYCTFGYYEKIDVQKLIDEVEKRYPSIPVGIWGSSLGGAVAIQSIAIDKRIKFGIVESTFSDLDSIVYDYMKLRLGFQNHFLAERALHNAEKIAHFDAKYVKPFLAVQQIKQPMFFAHGDKDENISMQYCNTIYKYCASSEKQITIVNGAGHHNLATIGGESYLNKMLQFIKKSIEHSKQ